MPGFDNSVMWANSVSLPNTNSLGLGVYLAGGYRFLHNIGTNNVFLGGSSGNLSITGIQNVGVGTQSLTNLSSGNNNIAIGRQAMFSNSDGFDNIAIGTNACSVSGSPSYNVFIGSGAGENNIGSDNIGIGPWACQGVAGASTSENIAIGEASLMAVTSATENCSIGWSSQKAVTAGFQNCSIGTGSLIGITTGHCNVSIGHNSGLAYAGAESSNILLQNSGVVGESNTIRIGKQGAGNQQENRCFIAGITGVTVSNTALVTLDTTTGQLGTKTIANLPSWTVISADQPAVVGAGYFCNKVGLLSLSLPATSAVGDVIEVSNINTAVGTAITQGAGQQIYYGALSTTLGAGGSLTSIAVGDSLKIVCRVANTFWQVVSSVGSWTVV